VYLFFTFVVRSVNVLSSWLRLNLIWQSAASGTEWCLELVTMDSAAGVSGDADRSRKRILKFPSEWAHFVRVMPNSLWTRKQSGSHADVLTATQTEGYPLWRASQFETKAHPYNYYNSGHYPSPYFYFKRRLWQNQSPKCRALNKNKTRDNVQNCDSHIHNLNSSPNNFRVIKWLWMSPGRKVNG
jgi:hypothetical protein